MTDLPADLTVETYPDALELVLENLLANAAEHSDRETPEVSISARTTGGAVEFTISDDGPGIPAQELSVLEADAETVLDHGSGLGLWITKSGVQYLGGTLTFEDNDPRGTNSTVTIPQSPIETRHSSVE